MVTAATNTLKVQTMFAQEALDVLENELQIGSMVYRVLEGEYKKEPNGYKIGANISMKKPPQYVPTSGATITAYQNTTEAEVTLTVDQRWKVETSFNTQELTLSMSDFRERVVIPATTPLADKIDTNLASKYVDLHECVGTAGTSMATFEDMQNIDTRFVQIAAPTNMRNAIFDPVNYAGLVSGAKAHFEQSIVKEALKSNHLGRYSNIDTFRSVHVKTHTGGTGLGTPLVNGASQTGSTLNIKGWTASSAVLKAGDVFTIADVYAVNPVSKQAYSHLKQFVVTADATATAGGLTATAISPAISTSGGSQNVSAGPAADAAITIISGTGANAHVANFAFTRQTFALACVPLMEAGGGVPSKVISSKQGLSVRLVEYYDGDTDLRSTRLDILFGTKTLYPETGIRILA